MHMLTLPIMLYVGRQPISVLGMATPITESMSAVLRPMVSPVVVVVRTVVARHMVCSSEVQTPTRGSVMLLQLYS